MQNVPIVSGATAYDDPDGTTYILVFHESLYDGKTLGHSLINPNQLRHNGVDFWDNPYDNERDLCIDTGDGLIIPLQFKGTKLITNTRVPTPSELSHCQHIHMTSRTPWEPQVVQLGETTTTTRVNRAISSVCDGREYLCQIPHCHAEEAPPILSFGAAVMIFDILRYIYLLTTLLLSKYI